MKTIIRWSKFGDEMIFEKLSRQEMSSYIRNYEAYSDSAMYWRLNDGSFGVWDETEAPKRRPPVSRIIAWMESNECSLVFWGEGKIEYNNETGFWDLNMKYL